MFDKHFGMDLPCCGSIVLKIVHNRGTKSKNFHFQNFILNLLENLEENLQGFLTRFCISKSESQPKRYLYLKNTCFSAFK